MLPGKTKEELSAAIWDGMNNAETPEDKEAFANKMAKDIADRLLKESKVENPDLAKAREDLINLSSGISKIKFTPQELSEIRHVLDKSGLQRIMGRWGYKGNRQGTGSD